MKKQIIGSGLSGLVGSRIVELLSSQFEFENLDLMSGINILNLNEIEPKIANSKAKTFIHLAAFTDVNAAWQERNNKNGLCYQINVLGSANIAKLCQKYHKFLVHFSTDFVFDGKKITPYAEKDKPNPIEWYGQTKFLAEKEIENSGCEFCIVRIAFPFRENFADKTDLVRKMIESFKNKNLYPMFFDQKITPTFIDDIAAGIKIILNKKPEGIYHLVGSTFLSPYELAKKIAKLVNFDSSLIKKTSLFNYLKDHPESRPYHKNLALSNEKAKKQLGIEMKTIDEVTHVFKKTN